MKLANPRVVDADCQADHIVGPELDFAGVDTGPHLQTHPPRCGNDCHRGAQGPGGRIEGGWARLRFTRRSVASIGARCWRPERRFGIRRAEDCRQQLALADGVPAR